MKWRVANSMGTSSRGANNCEWRDTVLRLGRYTLADVPCWNAIRSFAFQHGTSAKVHLPSRDTVSRHSQLFAPRLDVLMEFAIRYFIICFARYSPMENSCSFIHRNRPASSGMPAVQDPGKDLLSINTKISFTLLFRFDPIVILSFGN